MSGYFDPEEPKRHRCILPGAFGPHNGWRCACGEAYVRETLPARDTNPGESPYQWRRSPKHDQPKDKP